MELKKFLEEGAEFFLPNLSIDLVIIAYHETRLKCLLLRVEDKWMLPGGYIRFDESVDEAVKRNMKERTALEDPHIRFLSVFGKRDRQFSEDFKHAFEKKGLSWDKGYWINHRFVTLAYYSLVNIEKTQPAISDFDEEFAWVSFDSLPEMWLDHEEIALEARKLLKHDIRQQYTTYNLLPEHFTMPELHRLHEKILEEKLDRSRFQKKMLSTGLFERLPKLQKESPGRNPYQYRLKMGT